ncbi:zinc transporter 2-like isoform X1 [Schistocerca nitens]|uniref:zinc transporter 2-like isoform X1 n=2 Tax=Schistocerca nitens TaxID=7011 RepID=UPI002119AFFC|nr:zinc transporter 2-like isoform X1 [Schistocerca nitens]
MYEQQHADNSSDEETFEEDASLSNPLLKTEEASFCMRCSEGKSSRHLCVSVNNVCASSAEDTNDKNLFSNGDSNITTFTPCETTHCHHVSSQPYTSSECRKLLLATGMCVVFMVAEIIGGYAAGSLAVMTDAVHLMSDVVAFLVSLFAIWLSRHSPTRKFTFGFFRAEILCALASILLIWLITAVFVYLAVHRMLSGKYTIKTQTMMLVAGLGIVVNAVMGLVLHGSCNSLRGAHGHSHSEFSHSRSGINVRAAVIHVIGDLLQSIGVFVSAVVIHFYPGAKIADPLCTFVFSILVLTTTVSVFMETVRILLEGFPKHLNYETIMQTLNNIDGVRNVHDLHVWLLSVNKAVLTVHLAIDSSVESVKVLERATYKMRHKYGIHNLTIQIEEFSSETMASCLKCQPLSR